ncbi:MAG: hypothetical protein QOJ50_2127 [Cryptosporangiaceae bacterium]|nr:hypothetical protein [Cryptosporangiaceae bacterium]
MTVTRTARRVAIAATAVAALAGVSAAAVAHASAAPHPTPQVGAPAAKYETPSAPATHAAVPAKPAKPATRVRQQPVSHGGSKHAPAFDIQNATLPVPAFDSSCPSGPVKFTDGIAQKLDSNGKVVYELFIGGPVVTGDLNRDGNADTTISLSCYAPVHTNTVLLSYATNTGSAKYLGKAFGPAGSVTGFQMTGHDLAVTAYPERDTTKEPLNFRLHYTGSGFAETTGKAAYLIDWTRPMAFPLHAPVTVADGVAPCDSKVNTFTLKDDWLRHAEGHRNGLTYDIQVAMFGDVNGDGVTDALVSLSCQQTTGEGSGQWLYAYTVRNGAPKLLGFVTTDHLQKVYTGAGNYAISNKTISLTQAAGTSDNEVARTFRWNGHGFTGTPALPGFPNVDVAP